MTDFKKLWLYVTLYKVADWIRIIVVPLVIYEKTGSALYMASAYGITFIPWILSIFGGVISDKFSKKGILKLSGLLSSSMMVIIVILLSSANFNVFILMSLLFALSLIEPFTHPAEQSLIPLIVNSEELVSANSSIQLVNNTLATIGPIIGGLFSVYINLELALLLSSIFFGLSFIPISLISKGEETIPIKKGNLFIEIKEGVKVTLGERFVLGGAFLFFFTNLAIHLFQANLTYFIISILGYSAMQVSIILSLAGIGAILGSIFAKTLNKKFDNPELIISLSTFLAGCTTYLLIYANHYIFISIILGATYFLGSINVVTYFSARQKLIPKEYLGRVVSITRFISFLSIPIGAFLGGLLISNFDYTIYSVILISATIRTMSGIASFIFLKRN